VFLLLDVVADEKIMIFLLAAAISDLPIPRYVSRMGRS
jgi:hypothetical protein